MNTKLFERYLMELPAGGRVLDAGCGSGNNSRYVNRIRPDLRITCLDIDPAARTSVPEYADFVQSSVEDLSCFEEAAFDGILCFHVIEHVVESSRVVSEFERVLRPGGVIFAESPHWVTAVTPVGFNFYDDPTHVRPHTEASLRRLFARFDIEYVRLETAVYFYLDDLYGLRKRSAGMLFRKMLEALGLYRTAVFMIAKRTPGSRPAPGR